MGAVSLAQSLTVNEVLTSLDISRNCIGAAGGTALREALHANSSLVHMGRLSSLPFSIALRSSLEWQLRANQERADRLCASATSQTTHRDALLQLLPEQECYGDALSLACHMDGDRSGGGYDDDDGEVLMMLTTVMLMVITLFATFWRKIFCLS